jgi:membrane peptidoglycan carboxypeptidase
VLADYGGSQGTGSDFAGVYHDEEDVLTGFGMHPPGSSFMVYTLAAALQAGSSLNSYWEWQPHDQPGRTGPNRVLNSSTCPQDRTGACSLRDSVMASLNVPMYTVTLNVRPDKVLELARAAGIDSMWNDAKEYKDLAAATDLQKLYPSQFDTTLGLGQYSVTVLDQANAMATFGAGGHRAQAHFVRKIDLNDKTVYAEKLSALDHPSVLTETAMADLTSTLSSNPAGKLTVGDSASKSGSWEYQGRSSDNADAWTIGYTSKLALAVWVGDQKSDQAIKDANGATIWGTGLPSTIYRNVMNSVHSTMSLKPGAFPPAANAGNNNPPGSVPR